MLHADGQHSVTMAPSRISKIVTVCLTIATWAIAALGAVLLPVGVNRAVADRAKTVSSGESYGFSYALALFAAILAYFSILGVMAVLFGDAWRRHWAGRRPQ